MLENNESLVAVSDVQNSEMQILILIFNYIEYRE
jgi:hypothetical protein